MQCSKQFRFVFKRLQFTAKEGFVIVVPGSHDIAPDGHLMFSYADNGEGGVRLRL